MSDTYGNSSVPGVNVQTTGGTIASGMDDPIGKAGPTISLWGHNLILDGGSSVKCSVCEKEEEIPELLQMSSGFREVIYKMYILGQFRQATCEPEFEFDSGVLHTKTSNGDYIEVGYGDGRIATDGTYVLHSTCRDFDEGDVLTERQSLALRKRWEKQQQKKKARPSYKPHGLGDFTTPTFTNKSSTPDSSAITTTSTKTHDTISKNVDLDEDAEKSIKERFAAKLCEAKNLR